MAHIFLSYSRPDRSLADQLSHALQARGFSIWMDTRIPTGSRFSDQIDKELQRASCVIVLWTPSSVESKWVWGEATKAESLGTLLPVQLKQASIPTAFCGLQTLDLVGWPKDREQEFESLVVDIQRKVQERPQPPPQPEPEPEPEERESSPALRWIGRLTTLAVVVWLGIVFFREDHPTASSLAFADGAPDERVFAPPTSNTTDGGKPDARAESIRKQVSDFMIRLDGGRATKDGHTFHVNPFRITAQQVPAYVFATYAAGKTMRSAGGLLSPATVGWSDAREFIQWLNRTSGRRLRLPSAGELAKFAELDLPTGLRTLDGFAEWTWHCVDSHQLSDGKECDQHILVNWTPKSSLTGLPDSSWSVSSTATQGGFRLVEDVDVVADGAVK